MKEMMQKLNRVKYATSEEQKKELLSQGFLPVGKPSGGQVCEEKLVEPTGDGKGTQPSVGEEPAGGKKTPSRGKKREKGDGNA